jgi:hypothetical protein
MPDANQLLRNIIADIPGVVGVTIPGVAAILVAGSAATVIAGFLSAGSRTGVVAGGCAGIVAGGTTTAIGVAGTGTAAAFYAVGIFRREVVYDVLFKQQFGCGFLFHTYNLFCGKQENLW